jgi:hypothetical protein
MTKLDAEYDDSGWDKVEELVQEEAIEEYNTQVSSIGNSGPFYGKAGLTEASVMPPPAPKKPPLKKEDENRQYFTKFPSTVKRYD